MIQTFYDEENDQFILAPLRCGSSYTENIARTLGWKQGYELFEEVKKQNIYPTQDMRIIQHNEVLKIMVLMTHEKYKNSKWMTVIRDPWCRYVSAVNMILGTYYNAPGHVSTAEINHVQNMDGLYVSNANSIYEDVDRAIVNRNISTMGFDFTFQDTHCVPVLSVQLMWYALFDNMELVDLQDLESWFMANYPAGDKLQPDYYDLQRPTKRTNSSKPTGASLSVFKRFLAPLGFYDNKKAKRFDIETTFTKFIQYDFDCWELINSSMFNKDSASVLLAEMMEEPYFYARCRSLYQVFIGGPKLLNLSTNPIFKNTLTIMPEIQQFVFRNSWFNIDSEAYQT